MPLKGHGMHFVLVAEKYGLLYNLLPAIATQESTGGKHCLNHNPFGYGSRKTKFSDFGEAIEFVAERLVNGKYFKNKNLNQKLLAYNKHHEYKDKIFTNMKKIEKENV